jgi:TolB-like protein
MTGRLFLFAELKRRNVLRAAVLYAGAVWALAQGIAQLGPFFAAPEWTVRWFVIAAIIGFPFWIAFAWFYEFTPQGLKRESEIAPDDSTAHGTGKKLNFAIIGVLTLAVVLLLTNTFVWHEGAGLASQSTNNAAVFARIPGKSVAVLPLVNESGAKDQQYFSDGLSEDLITALSQFAGLKVINRDSSFQFRDSKDSVQLIGEQLGVAHLLEGSVQKLGDEVRISAELVNCADGSTLWSEHYDRPYKVLFALHRNQEASSQLGRALAIDPNFRLAHTIATITDAQAGRFSQAMVHARSSFGPDAAELLVRGMADPGLRERVVQELETSSSPSFVALRSNSFAFAQFLALLGARDRALDALEDLAADHAVPEPMQIWSTGLDSIRNDPRFKAVLKKMGLPYKAAENTHG